MSYWIKLFSDGTQEKGTDTNIARGKASWSKGRLASMIGAIIRYAGKTVRIDGMGPYWQKDTAVASYNLPPKRIARQLGKKINSEDIGWALLLGGNVGSFTIRIARDKLPHHVATRIEPRHIGHYLVVTISNTGDVKMTVETNFHV